MSERPGVVVASRAGIFIASPRDASDAVGAAFGARGVILGEPDVAPAFFDLRTGLAGEVFQKFTNYRIRLALVVPDPAAHGERFAELAYEHAAHNLIRFFRTEEDAAAWLNA